MDSRPPTSRSAAVVAAIMFALSACAGSAGEVASTADRAVSVATEPAATATVQETPTQAHAAAPTESAAEATEVPQQPAPAEDAEATTSDPTPTTVSARPAVQTLLADEAIANAESNIDLLKAPANNANVADVEVLAVGDGSIQSLRDVVVGDRPVLLWFFSPH